MVHGDDQGLVLPPRLAPIQVVIVPIHKNEDERTRVMEAATGLHRELVTAGIRVKLDARDGLTPGFKFNDWEMRGVPLRVEIGPKDVEKTTVVLARRDRPGKEGKIVVSREGAIATITSLLEDIQLALLKKATAFRDAHLHDVTDYESFKQAVEKGFARVWWDGDAALERQIKEETKATLRCIPLDQPDRTGTCFMTGRPTRTQAIFARAY